MEHEPKLIGEVLELRENMPRTDGLGRQDLGGRSGIVGEEAGDEGPLSREEEHQSEGV